MRYLATHSALGVYFIALKLHQRAAIRTCQFLKNSGGNTRTPISLGEGGKRRGRVDEEGQRERMGGRERARKDGMGGNSGRSR